MSDSPKDVVRGFYESYNQQDLDATWERYVSPELTNHALGGAYDREAWLGADKSLFPAFPNLEVKVLDQVEQGDKVATRYSMTGTQTQEFFGVPSKGATATMTGTSFDLVKDGRIVEHWADIDLGGFMQQLTA